MTLVAADARAYLSIENPARYQLGDSAGNPLLVLNAVDTSGVMWLCEEPTGWDAPAAVTPLDRKQYGHGAYAGDTYLSERILTFTGSAAAPTAQAALDARARLVNAVYTNLTGDAIYTHLDETPAKSLFVRPGNGAPKVTIADSRWIDYQFQLIAEDPFKRGAAATYGPGRLPGSSATPGRTYPRKYPMTYGTPGANPPSTGIQVPNPGDVDGDAIYVITGPVPTPQIHLGNGQYAAFGLTLAGGANPDVLTINTAEGSAVVNGASRLDALLSGSTFPLIPANGGTEVRLSSLGGGSSPAASLYVTTTPTWK